LETSSRNLRGELLKEKVSPFRERFAERRENCGAGYAVREIGREEGLDLQ